MSHPCPVPIPPKHYPLSGVSFEGGEPEEDSDGSGLLVMADGTVLTLPKTKAGEIISYIVL